MEPSAQPNQPLPTDANNPLEVMQPGEQVICEIKRHPIGLIGIYASTGLVIAVLLSVAILAPYYLTVLTDQEKLGIILAAGLGVLTTLIFTYIGVYVYQSNRWIVTSDSVTQIAQNSLFSRDTSQLSLANLEDVSIGQDSFWQSLIGYGDLIVESAGEHSKFIFNFCPNPNDYAKRIIAAHEQYIAHRQEEVITANRPLAVVQNFNQPTDQPPVPTSSGPTA